MLKDFQVDLELSPRDNRVIQTGATYWSHDVNTAKIVVNLKRNSEPIILSSTVSVRMIMVFDDNDTQKKQVHKMTIDDTQNGVVSLVLPKETIGFVGNVLCGVYVNYGENQSTDNGYFTFSMRRSLIDGDFPQLENGYVSEFQTMLDYMIETASEFDNVEEELNKRIDVIEKDIASNEVAKQEELDNLKVGGLNLLDGTKRFSQPWRSMGGTPQKDSDGFYFYRLFDSYGKWVFQPFNNWEKGEKYILSFYARSEQDVQINPKIEAENTPILSALITSREFKFYEIKFTANFESTTGALQFLTRQNTSYIDIKKVKLEKATKSAGWQLSANETVDKIDIDSLQKQINELKNAITTLGGTL